MGEVSPLNQLASRYRERGFTFLTIYVREPHPGEHYGHHTSFEQKMQYARDCRAQDGLEIPVLVDDLEGTVHRQYGWLPNMAYVVDKRGIIVYKAMWTDHEEIASVLANLAMADDMQAQGVRLKPSFSQQIHYIPASYGEDVRERVFGRAGPRAWADYKQVFSPGDGPDRK